MCEKKSWMVLEIHSHYSYVYAVLVTVTSYSLERVTNTILLVTFLSLKYNKCHLFGNENMFSTSSLIINSHLIYMRSLCNTVHDCFNNL